MPLVPRDHDPDDPDDFSYNIPQKPSELTSLGDADLFRLLRKVAFANNWQFDAKVQFEATGRLIAALKDFKTSSDRSGRILIFLTVVLIALTVVIVVLTVALLRHHS
jgi:hypothetical protein